MKYERINKNYTKIIVISLTLIIIIGSVLVLNITKAKYRTTVSVPIVSGTVKYTGGNADLNVMAVYQQKDDAICTEDNCYDIKDDIPKTGYILNNNKSYCTTPGSNNKIKNNMVYNDSKVSIDITKKGTKCYLYFDTTGSGKTLKKLGLESNGQVTDFSKTACSEGCGTTTENGVYEVADDFGTSYYFRGSIENNWVKFGNMSTDGADIYWRIIRINGDGTIRLIYSGNGSPASTPADTQIGTSSFNSSTDDNIYLGYQYESRNAHGKKEKSNILTTLENWFSANLVDEWSSENRKIDINAGFCNDRSSSTNKSTEWLETGMTESGGTGTTPTYYGAYLRLVNSNKTPTLKCSTNNHKDEDYFTYTEATGIQSIEYGNITGTKSLDYPIGLITADEVAFAGGKYGSDNNTLFWLCTKNRYWTITPYERGYAFSIDEDGKLSNWGDIRNPFAIRPVINLKADTTFTIEHLDQPKGTSTNPYIVS